MSNTNNMSVASLFHLDRYFCQIYLIEDKQLWKCVAEAIKFLFRLNFMSQLLNSYLLQIEIRIIENQIEKETQFYLKYCISQIVF